MFLLPIQSFYSFRSYYIFDHRIDQVRITEYWLPNDHCRKFSSSRNNDFPSSGYQMNVTENIFGVGVRYSKHETYLPTEVSTRAKTTSIWKIDHLRIFQKNLVVLRFAYVDMHYSFTC